jgi:hypothetical protein
MFLFEDRILFLGLLEEIKMVNTNSSNPYLFEMSRLREITSMLHYVGRRPVWLRHPRNALICSSATLTEGIP